MKISILCIGTRGDVQPNLALAKALKARGHEVVLGAPDNFKDWIEKHNIRFHPMGVDIQEIMQSPDIQKLMRGNIFAYRKVWRTIVTPMINASLQATWEASRDADLIIYHPKANAAYDIGEKTGAHTIYATPTPIFTTGAFPLLNFTWNLGPWFNRQTYKLMMLGRILFRGAYNRWRKETLDLGKGPWFMPVEGHGEVLCAVSPSVLQVLEEERDRIHMTGYWFLDEQPDWKPDTTLQAFLDAGEPPIYIGFGSMPSKDPRKVTQEVIAGVERSGTRAILATGWGGMEALQVPQSIHIIDSAPHEILFKHVKAVVHHGGAGSTAAGLRAGLPTLVCPLAVDQPFWGNHIHKLGCGPKPLHQKKLRGKIFGERLKQLVQTESYTINAKKIAQTIAQEDGITEAVKIIEKYDDSQISQKNVVTEAN